MTVVKNFGVVVGEVLIGKHGVSIRPSSPAGDEDADQEYQAAPIPGLTEGRIVHFVLEDGENTGEHRPAMIVRIWDKFTGLCNLQVFADPSDHPMCPTGIFPAQGRRPDEGLTPGTWHWIEKA